MSDCKDENQVSTLDLVENRVREPLEPDSTKAVSVGRPAIRMQDDKLKRTIDLGSERVAQTGSLVPVPVTRFTKLASG